MTASLAAAALTIVATGLCGCRHSPLPELGGVLLVSIDTLRADHLPCYGYRRDTAPFLCSLGAGGVLVEHAVSQYPGTLPSHMSLFTGLYPTEHGVLPPDRQLAAELATLPEIFRRAGFRTAGFTEAGNVKGYFGFDRGFEIFSDDNDGKRHRVADTFARGRAFLERLSERDRFFLFLHTYEVHTPYEPPASHQSLFWEGEPPLEQRPTARRLERFNQTGRRPTREQLEYLVAMYDASIRHVDEELERVVRTLETIGRRDDTLIVVLSDHGEEFWEHGMLMHYQLYPETLQIPLILHHPELASGLRLKGPIELVDVAPTLLELAGLADADGMSGDSFAGRLVGSGDGAGRSTSAFGERVPGGHETLFYTAGGSRYQLIVERMPEGIALGRSVSFDLGPSPHSVTLRSLGEPRRITIHEPGRRSRRQTVRTEPTAIPFAAAERSRRVTLVARSCTQLTTGCFSFELVEPSLLRFELYDLEADPGAQDDLSRRRPRLLRILLEELERYELAPRRPPERIELDDEHRKQLEALGYVGG